MKIGIDMDGVIIDTINFISKEFSDIFGCLITPDDIAHKLGEIKGADEIFLERGEYLLCSLDPMDKAAEVINSLNENHEIYIISARFSIHYDATVKWLNEHEIKVNEVLFTEGSGKADICRKYDINLFIEDSMKNALEIASAGIKVILLTTDYNSAVKSSAIEYCDDWDDIYRYVNSKSP